MKRVVNQWNPYIFRQIDEKKIAVFATKIWRIFVVELLESLFNFVYSGENAVPWPAEGISWCLYFNSQNIIQNIEIPGRGAHPTCFTQYNKIFLCRFFLLFFLFPFFRFSLLLSCLSPSLSPYIRWYLRTCFGRIKKNRYFLKKTLSV